MLASHANALAGTTLAQSGRRIYNGLTGGDPPLDRVAAMRKAIEMGLIEPEGKDQIVGRA
jgi:hypothetical protein